MRKWLPYRHKYLSIILQQAAPETPLLCNHCGGRASYRCRSCSGYPLSCQECLVTSHQQLPFHRVQRWNKVYFEETTLQLEGMVVNLGHSGSRCPHEHSPSPSFRPRPTSDAGRRTPSPERGETDVAGPSSDDDRHPMQSPPRKRPRPNDAPSRPEPIEARFFDEDREDWVDDEGDDNTSSFANPSPFTEYLKVPPRYNKDGQPILIVVDVSGIHYITIHSCACLQDVPPADRLLRAGLYPASDVNPRTVFTFAALDDFLLQNKECHTSIANYYSKLRRLTSFTHPHLVPVSPNKLINQMRTYSIALVEPREGIWSCLPSVAKPASASTPWVWTPTWGRTWAWGLGLRVHRMPQSRGKSG